MTAKEVRDYRSTSKKLVEVEEKTKLLEELRRRKVCLGEEEIFFHNLQEKFKTLGKEGDHRVKQHEELVSITLKYKIKDNVQHGVKLRKKRNKLRGIIEENGVVDPVPVEPF